MSRSFAPSPTATAPCGPKPADRASRAARFAARPRIGRATVPVSRPPSARSRFAWWRAKPAAAATRSLKKSKPPETSCGVGSQRRHGAHQDPRPGVEAHAIVVALLQHPLRQPREQRDPGVERALEIELAPHRRFGDRGDLRLHPGEVRQLVDALNANDRRIHVRDQEALPPPLARHHVHIESRASGERRRCESRREGAVETDLQRRRRQPPRRFHAETLRLQRRPCDGAGRVRDARSGGQDEETPPSHRRGLSPRRAAPGGAGRAPRPRGRRAPATAPRSAAGRRRCGSGPTGPRRAPPRTPPVHSVTSCPVISKWHAAGDGALGAMHREEARAPRAGSARTAGSCSRCRRLDHVAVHRVAAPDHRAALALDGADQPRQVLGDDLPAPKRVISVIRPASFRGFSRSSSRSRSSAQARAAFQPDRVPDAAQELDMRPVRLAGAVADPQHVPRSPPPGAGRRVLIGLIASS